ncbi:putative peroxisome assembly protein [Trypanosoma conorhini]|uniref:Peroxisomal ATPase PEX6 n=1 Tax=Trypanosoma conorhini TaxID=83891 RepID=A0A3S5IT83_9TRYP|nr:putative peroxisome assembly protein [Trypanosoma conorhini]RNF17031.1 putative peroxisome assembly protein [Trypanosoma conorhini]
MDGAVVCVGDEEYTTTFAIRMRRRGEEPLGTAPALYAAPDVFRNIRASILLDPLPPLGTTSMRYSDWRMKVPFSAFRPVLDSGCVPLTLVLPRQGCDELQLSGVVVAPAWPPFMLAAFFGDTYEQILTLALRASKEQLSGRIVSEGDVLVLRVTCHLFFESQLVCTDVAEAVLTHVAHLAQSGDAETATRSLMHNDGIIAIPLRVVEVTTSSGRPFGWLDLNGGETEVVLSLHSTAPCADVTPLFPPLRQNESFYLRFSLTVAIVDALGSVFSPSHSAGTHVFVVHALPENFPYESITTALAVHGVGALIVDLDRRQRDEMQHLSSEYMQSMGEVALVVKNAQLLSEHPQLLHLFDTDDNEAATTTARVGVRVVFLVCESTEAPPPTVAARARNVGGVLKGTNPCDADRRLILETLFQEAQRSFGICKSLLLSFDAMAAWTVGLSGADVVAYMQECLSLLRSMRLPEGVRPVLSESLSGSVLQTYQKAHGHNLVSTKLQPVRWKDVGGLEEAKRELRETIQLPLLHPDLFSNGTKRRAGILFYGPPGCGKTLLAKAVATEMNMNFMAVKGPELINQYVGESEKNIRLLFQRARDNSPCIIFFDELDALAPARGAKGDAGGAMDRVVAQLLVEVDGVGHTRTDGTTAAQVFIIGATNRPDLLDPSLLRPGRFDRLCYLGLPATREEQLVALRALTRKFDLADDVDFNALLEPLGLEYTGADFFALCSDAMMFAVEAVLENIVAEEGEPAPAAANGAEEAPRLVVQMRDFVRARDQLKPSVSEHDLKRYESLQSKFTAW